MRIFSTISIFFVAAGLVIVACDSSGSSVTEYGGPGSDLRFNKDTSDNTWTWTKAENVEATNAGTFQSQVSGSFEALDSGFLKLTVSASDTDGAAAGDVRYAMEVPGFTTVTQPILGEDGIEAALNLGSCPTSDMTLNWISPETDSPNARTRDIWGSFTYDFSELAGTVNGGFTLTDDFSADAGFSSATLSGSCEDGILNVDGDGEDVAIYLNPAGGALVDTGENLIVAMPSTELAAADMDGDYFGLALISGAVAQTGLTGLEDGVIPVSVEITGSGTAASITAFDSVDDNTLESSTFASLSGLTYNTTNDLSGAITGTMTIQGNDANVMCLAAADAGGTGKNILYCQSYDPTYGNGDGTDANPGIGIGFLLRQD